MSIRNQPQNGNNFLLFLSLSPQVKDICNQTHNYDGYKIQKKKYYERDR